MKRVSIYLFSLIVGFLLAIGFSQVLAAFSEPTASPPGNNVAEPVNISTTTQYKGGALGVGGVFQADSLAVFNGNVGIGTSSPGTNKLEVVGGTTKATGGLIIETRTSDPASPEVGRLWLRTDL